MGNKAQLIGEIKRLLSGEEEGQIFFATKDYPQGVKPQPSDLFEATTSTGQKVVKRYCEVKGKLRLVIWREGQTYEIDNLGGSIFVKDEVTANNLRKLIL